MVDSSFDYHAALSACAQGDPAALQRLYAQEAPRMLALANIMLGDQTAAQNAVHDAFVLVWKNAGSYDSRTGSARAWIYSIMRYRTLSMLRRSLAPASSAPVTPSVLPAYEDGAAGVAAALQQQPDGSRKPVLMAFYNGMNYSDIAARLGCSVAELRNRVRSCLRALRECEPA